MQQGTIHIIGAGLAGLSAATLLAAQGKRVALYEATHQAGGRCRSYEDATFGAVIDNGNHLLLSGNRAALAYLKRIGANTFAHGKNPHFDFIDASTKQCWKLRLNKGRLPFWLFDKTRRVPDTNAFDYFSAIRLLTAKPKQTAADILGRDTILYKKLWHPLLVSALNTNPTETSATLAAAVLRGTLLKGGNACIPMIADGLSAVFIDPALHTLAAHGANSVFNRRVRSIDFSNGRAIILQFAEGEQQPVHAEDTIICAVPPWVATALLPGITAPDEFRAILNAHFKIAPPAGFPKIIGVLNATTEWIFAFPDRISITVSDADRLMQEDREVLALRLWQEVAAITGLERSLPPWQIVKEKRATFAATPQQNAKRPGTHTPWSNIFLAGDWVQTGLPATIEGAVRSGELAAKAVMEKR